MFSSLYYRDYRYLWTGTLFMSAGQWIQQVTLGWLVYDLTGSSVLLGLLNGLRSLPFLIVGPSAGVAADRLDRRKLLLAIQAFLMSVTFIMGTVVITGHVEVWHVFLFTACTATAWSVNQTVRQTLAPNVVPRHEIMNAIALNSLAFNITKVLGPALGGVLIAYFGAGGNFYVQAAAYLGVLIAISLMHLPKSEMPARAASVFANLKEGLDYVRSTPIVLALMVSALVPSIFAQPYQTLMPVFQKDILQVGPGALGLMLAAPGVGAIISALLLASIANSVRRKGILLLIALGLLGTSLILFSQMTALPLALLTLVGVGGCQVFYAATTNTMLQVIVPDELRGRVSSIYMLDVGLSPLGAFAAGVSASIVGAPTTVAAMGLAVIGLAALVAWRMPQIHRFEA
jgi:predicted MFS family arabinose efflux permease